MKKICKINAVILASLLILCSCRRSYPVIQSQCDNSNTEFNKIFNNLVNTAPAGTYQDIRTYDSEIHSYTFEVLNPQTICSVGYQSEPALTGISYSIEIWRGANTTPEASVTSTFSSTGTSYVNLPVPLLVTPGNVYVIKRIQTNWSPDITRTIGRLVKKPAGNVPFPQVFGDLKITGSKLYQNATTQTDWAIPFIDIVFQH